MQIIEDKAQKETKHKAKNDYFKSQGIEVLRIPLPIGDYIVVNDLVADVLQRKAKRNTEVKKMDLLGTYKICVDTKFSIGELYQDLIQDHARFHDEVHLAMNNNVKLIILVENKDGITCVKDMVNWKNPRMFKYYKDCRLAKVNGTKPPKPPCSNVQLIKIMHTMSKEYGVVFEFCRPDEAGRKVLEFLEVVNNE